MKKVLLDSSFIISATEKKIDIFNELQDYPEILIPEQVLEEIFRVSNSKQSAKNKRAAELALKIINLELTKFKKIDLGPGHTDKQIMKYLEKNPEILVATLDKEIKSKLKGKLIILRGNNIDFS